MFLRLVVVFVGVVFPSAASTQVVPNGGKGGTAAEGATSKTHVGT